MLHTLYLTVYHRVVYDKDVILQILVILPKEVWISAV